MKLTAEERKRELDGMTLLRILSNETSVVQKNLSPSNAANVPGNSSQDILNVLHENKNHEVYGSLAMQTKTFRQRKPNDIDVVVDNPRMFASTIAQRLSMKGHKVDIESNPEYGSHVVRIKQKHEWKDVVDIHPINEHKKVFDVYGKSIPPTNIGGINIQVAADQLLRKANSVMAYDPKTHTFGASPKRKLKDVTDFVNTSRLLIDSKQLQAEAELAKVHKARKALKSWERHAIKLGAGKTKDPIPETQEQRFIKHAVNNPKLDVEKLTFRNKKSFNKPKEEHFWGTYDKNFWGL